MVDRPNKPTAISAPSPSTDSQPTVDFSSDSGRLTASLPSGETVEILVHGATVVSWKSEKGKRENLWLSEASALDGSKAVRGGIPVVFPVFGPPPANHATSKLPQHGFARNCRWEFLGKSTSESGSETSIKLDFGLSSNTLPQATSSLWPSPFSLIYSVSLTPSALQTVLTVQNDGKADLEFQMLLHTYLRVPSISRASLTGLAGAEYVDKVLDKQAFTEKANELKFHGETDRVYSGLKQDTTSVLVDGKPAYDVVRDNLDDTVVWNPWKEKANAMGDFQPKSGYENMLCVEVGAVAGWTKLEAGEGWEGGQIIKAL